MPDAPLQINRAPVLTLWAVIVAERLGHPRATALTLGKAVAGLNAQSKGRRLGVFEPPSRAKAAEPAKRGASRQAETVSLLGREIPTALTSSGPRAIVKDKVVTPESVDRYLTQKFGEALTPVTEAMQALASSRPPAALAADAYALYERFRPAIPDGVRGWGAKGELDLALLRRLAKRRN